MKNFKAELLYTVKCRKVVFDHLDKAFCILKLDTEEADKSKEPREDQEGREQFIIRRMDLIVAPPHQYPFAIVSWTGSKVC